MRYVFYLQVLFVGAFVLILSQPAFAQKLEAQINPEIQKTLKAAITEKQRRGYQDLKLLYYQERGEKVRLVYSAVNTKMDAKLVGTDKWLLGIHCAGKNSLYGQWHCSNPKSMTYRQDNSLDKMKAWADLIEQ